MTGCFGRSTRDKYFENQLMKHLECGPPDEFNFVMDLPECRGPLVRVFVERDANEFLIISVEWCFHEDWNMIKMDDLSINQLYAIQSKADEIGRDF